LRYHGCRVADSVGSQGTQAFFAADATFLSIRLWIEGDKSQQFD